MVKRLMLILVALVIVGIALPAFAEVQNVKVSGDITAFGISRSGYNLGNVNKSDDTESHAASIMRLRVDADLTENVSTTVRLLNERDWGGNTGDLDGSTVGTVLIDLAYVSLKEFLYSPLSLTIGRQELHFGNDFIIGDPDTNNQVSGASMSDADLSSKKAFDAVRATLNYDPLVIDAFWAKIEENNVFGATGALLAEKDDVDAFGVNARYDFGGKYKTIGELYWFGKVDSSNNDIAHLDKKATRVNNIGARVEVSPTERLNLQGELAWQFGKTNNVLLTNTVKQNAMAAQGIARYALDMKYDPVLMAIYTYYSGNRDNVGGQAWDPMYENQTAGHIINFLFNASNAHNLNLRASIVPVKDMTLSLDYVWLNLAQEVSALAVFNPAHTSSGALTSTNLGKKHLGDEIDVTLKYDYTEDVQLGLLAGWFKPGNVFTKGGTSVTDVKELIASCKVSF